MTVLLVGTYRKVQLVYNTLIITFSPQDIAAISSLPCACLEKRLRVYVRQYVFCLFVCLFVCFSKRDGGAESACADFER